MGQFMICATTPKSMVAQGSANHLKTGAPLPPSPKGGEVVVAQRYLHRFVVAQHSFSALAMKGAFS